MARGVTLVELLDDLRAACRMSLNPAHNAQVRDSHISYLNHAQRWLWEDFNWPHLPVYRDVPLQAGQRYYDAPADILADRIVDITVRDGAEPVRLLNGVDVSSFALYDSDLDERSWPVRRWQPVDNTIEVWPIPDSNADLATLDGVLKVRGVRNLRALRQDSDRCDLDSRLIVAYAAAEYLASTGQKDAPLKLANAKALYVNLRGASSKRRSFRLDTGRQDYRNSGRPLAVVTRHTTEG